MNLKGVPTRAVAQSMSGKKPPNKINARRVIGFPEKDMFFITNNPITKAKLKCVHNIILKKEKLACYYNCFASLVIRRILVIKLKS